MTLYSCTLEMALCTYFQSSMLELFKFCEMKNFYKILYMHCGVIRVREIEGERVGQRY